MYLQVREFPAPLNIPIPTPADRGGPVACLGGPIALFMLVLLLYSEAYFVSSVSFFCILLVSGLNW